jgi:hypothetical protein
MRMKNNLSKLIFCLAAAFAVLAPGLPAAGEPPLPLNLEAYIYSYGYSSTPAVGDVDNDGRPEIVFGSVSNYFYNGGYGYLQVVRKKADNSVERVLTKHMGGIPRAPALGDIDKDGIPEIVVFVSKYYGSSGMRVEALHADGSVLWSTPISDYGYYYYYYGDHAISLGDVNGDTYPDVVAISRMKLTALSGLDGSIIWQKTYGTSQTPRSGDWLYGKTAVVNLDNEGGNEVIHVHATRKIVYVYRSDGTLWWTAEGGEVAIADLELDGMPEVITKTTGNIYDFKAEGKLMVYSHSGELKWVKEYPFGISYLSGMAIADLDQDGYPEIAAAVSEYAIPGRYMPRYNYVVSVGGETGAGVEEWRSPLLPVGEFDNPSLTATDLDGDGSPEVTVISDDVAAFALDGPSGAVLWRSSVNIDENEHSPIIADVDGDGHAEIVSPGGTGVPYVSVLGDDLHFARTRETWNQMSYYFSNVRSDLSITSDYTPWRTHNTWRTQLPEFVDIEATVEIHPETLNLKSKGKWVSCIITLPEGYLTDDIITGTISLEGDIPAEHALLTGYSLNLKFDRTELIGKLSPGSETVLTVTGQLADGTLFKGTDAIRVIEPGKKK